MKRDFWCMVYSGSGPTYSELKKMDFAEYEEAVAARILYQTEWGRK